MIKSLLSVVVSVFNTTRIHHVRVCEGPLTIPTFVFRAYIICYIRAHTHTHAREWRITHYGACIQLHRLSMLCYAIVESVRLLFTFEIYVFRNLLALESFMRESIKIYVLCIR